MTITIIDSEKLAAYRSKAFRIQAGTRIQTKAQAIDFVNERGFVFFWPITGIEFPSLWTAVAGNRPVASAHDDPGHITWGWKDDLLDKKTWYYAKILRGKATMISLETVPYFYALSNNYGDPEADYLGQYREGLLSQPAKTIFETLLSDGSLDTVTLRRKIRMTSKASNSPFERALVELQRDFKILPVGIARTGGWRYSFIYQPVHTYFPDIPKAAQAIPETAAREHMILTQVKALGAVTSNEIGKLFQWRPKSYRRALDQLVESEAILAGARVAGTDADHFTLPELVRS